MQSRSSSNLKGIDVSHWQGDIDWQKVKAAGIQFAFVKATDGVGTIDPKFRRNAGGAHAVGIPVGFYHFGRAYLNKVNDELDHFCRTVAGLPVDLPYVLDLEGDDNAALGIGPLAQWAVQWLEGVKKRTGKNVMIYTGSYFARDCLGRDLRRYPLWVAHYGQDKPLGNTTWNSWAVFQYSQTGSCPGIDGNVDLNVMEADFMADQKKKDDITGHWAEQAIRKAMADGVMTGYPDGTFRPDEPVTRAELAAVLQRLK